MSVPDATPDFLRKLVEFDNVESNDLRNSDLYQNWNGSRVEYPFFSTPTFTLTDEVEKQIREKLDEMNIPKYIIFACLPRFIVPYNVNLHRTQIKKLMERIPYYLSPALLRIVIWIAEGNGDYVLNPTMINNFNYFYYLPILTSNSPPPLTVGMLPKNILVYQDLEIEEYISATAPFRVKRSFDDNIQENIYKYKDVNYFRIGNKDKYPCERSEIYFENFTQNTDLLFGNYSTKWTCIKLGEYKDFIENYGTKIPYISNTELTDEQIVSLKAALARYKNTAPSDVSDVDELFDLLSIPSYIKNNVNNPAMLTFLKSFFNLGFYALRWGGGDRPYPLTEEALKASPRDNMHLLTAEEIALAREIATNDYRDNQQFSENAYFLTALNDAIVQKFAGDTLNKIDAFPEIGSYITGYSGLTIKDFLQQLKSGQICMRVAGTFMIDIVWKILVGIQKTDIIFDHDERGNPIHFNYDKFREIIQSGANIYCNPENMEDPVTAHGQ